MLGHRIDGRIIGGPAEAAGLIVRESSLSKNSKTSSDSVETDLTPGRRLGKYSLEKRLGAGGSCEVWRARDRVEDIQVALKIPLQGVGGRRDNQQLFREIRLVARLRHPHLMPVKNADVIEDYAILATELCAGTLEDRSRPMSVKRITGIILQVLDGLAYAHQHRVVHCDVTPGNIFLFPGGRAALGDFGISLKIKGRMVTVDDFGTPGYVAPEQAYGKPTYHSDCFAVALIMYEYITGVLPRWPFRWPPRGYQRLRKRTSLAVVAFLKRALAVDPGRRFADAGQMRTALIEALPRHLRSDVDGRIHQPRRLDWRKLRRESFLKRYDKIVTAAFRCVDCGEPVAESMAACPWCGSERNRFDAETSYTHVCPRCHRGVWPEWRFCPWCYGPGFESPSATSTNGVRYQGHCQHCKGKLMRFMRYCPWCRRKVRKPWKVRPFGETCVSCNWSVDSQYWTFCPWCKQCLVT